MWNRFSLFVHKADKARNVIITIRTWLTPLLSTGFSHSSSTSMAVFGPVVTFSNSNQSSLFYCTAGFMLCPLDMRPGSVAVVYSLASVMALNDADCTLTSGCFCMPYTPDIKCCPGLKVDMRLCFFFIALQLPLVWFNHGDLQLSLKCWSCVISSMNSQLSICIADSLAGWITEYMLSPSDNTGKALSVDLCPIWRIHLFISPTANVPNYKI